MRMRPITPLEDGLQSCVCIEQDTEETAKAVQALEKELQNSSNDKEMDTVSETKNAVRELEKELRSDNGKENETTEEVENFNRVISEEEGSTERDVIQAMMDMQGQANVDEFEFSEISGRKVQKRKRIEEEESEEVMEQEIRRRRVDENEHIDDVNDLTQKEPDRRP